MVHADDIEAAAAVGAMAVAAAAVLAKEQRKTAESKERKAEANHKDELERWKAETQKD